MQVQQQETRFLPWGEGGNQGFTLGEGHKQGFLPWGRGWGGEGWVWVTHIKLVWGCTAWEPDLIVLPYSRQQLWIEIDPLFQTRSTWKWYWVNMRQDPSRTSVHLQCDPGRGIVSPVWEIHGWIVCCTLFETETLICRPYTRPNQTLLSGTSPYVGVAPHPRVFTQVILNNVVNILWQHNKTNFWHSSTTWSWWGTGHMKINWHMKKRPYDLFSLDCALKCWSFLQLITFVLSKSR